MDYESRRVKWYWLLLFVVYSGAAVYLLFKANPFLYSHLELRKELSSSESEKQLTIPTEPETLAKLGPSMYEARFGSERTAVDPLGSPRSMNYVEYERFPVETGVEGFEVHSIVGDSTGFYLTGRSPWVVAVGVDGKARWKFRFKNLSADRALLPVLVDDQSAYAVHPSGEVISFAKTDGHVRWIMPVDQEVVAAPFIWERRLILPVKGQTGIQIVQIDRSNGRLLPESPKLDIKPGFQISHNDALKALIATVDNKLVAIDPVHWTILWSQTLTDPVKGPAVLVGSSIFLSTMDGKVMRLDGSKKGKIDWELDLEKPPASAPSFLPVVNRLSLMDTSGTLALIDSETGKLMWTQASGNRNPAMETWSSRLKGNFIEEYKMDWLHKGWTVWSPCSERRFCIYSPGKGQQIGHIPISGEPLALPLPVERRWLFFTVTKPGKYMISHVLEQSEIKQLRLEAASAQVGNQ